MCFDMEKKQIKLNENDLKAIIRNSVVRYLKENADEVLDTPEAALGAVYAADADKKKHPGRSKDSKDPEIRRKRDRQMGVFGDKAAQLMTGELGNDPRFTVKGDRGARTMQYQNGPKSAFLRADSDFDSTPLYDADYQEGDEKQTLANLDPAERDATMSAFEKFKELHRRAREKYDSRLEESVKKHVADAVKKLVNETTLDYDMDNFSGRWGRGPRYDILVDGEVYYSDVPDESVDKLCSQLSRQGYENIMVQEL